MEYKDLSDRKKKILNAVVNSYIDKAEPISSSELKQDYFENISSATIRSELSALEEMGYLMQPHTSSGRVPSAEAYRVYVENMLTEGSLSEEEIGLIGTYFEGGVMAIEDIVRQTAKVISEVTNYTSVIVLKDASNIKIRRVQLVDVGDRNALVIIVTDSGIISNKTIQLPVGVSEGFLSIASQKLNNVFSGKYVSELSNTEELIDDEIIELEDMIRQIVKILRDFDKKDDKVLLEGSDKILQHREYDSIEETKNFLSIINKKEQLHDIISADSDIEFSLKIGGEDTGGLEHCAIVTAKYSVGGKELGQAGVIGPERMDYKKIKAVLQYVSKLLSKFHG